MAYTSLELETTVLEADDALSFKIWDNSTGWNDEEETTDVAVLTVIHSVYGTIELDIIGADYAAYLSDDGLEVTLEDLGLDDEDFFVDGYYQIKLTLSNDSSVTEEEYTNHQAFLSHNRSKARKVASKLTYPDMDYTANYEAFLLIALMAGAEEQVSTGDITRFSETMEMINEIFEKYEIDDVF